MKYTIHLILLAVLFLVGQRSRAQQPAIHVIVAPTVSNHLSDWQSDPAAITLSLLNPTTHSISARIGATLTRDGELIAKVRDNAGVVITLQPGSTIIHGSDAIQFSAIEFFGATASTTQRSGTLPDGIYTICASVQVVGSTPSTGTTLLSSDCAVTKIIAATAPILITPANGDTTSIGAITFTWMAAPSMSGANRYEFEIIPIIPGQTSTAQFSSSGIALREQTTAPSMTLPTTNITGIIPSPTKTYIWKVTLITPEGERLASLPSTVTIADGNTEPGPCDKIKTQIEEYKKDLQTDEQNIQHFTAYRDSLQHRIDSLKQQRKRFDSLEQAYQFLQRKFFGKYIASADGGFEYRRIADSMEQEAAKAYKVYRAISDSLSIVESVLMKFNFSNALSHAISDAESHRSTIDRLTKECSELLHEQTEETERLEQIVTSSKECLRHLDASIDSMRQLLDSLKNIGRNDYRIAEAITTLQNSIGRVIKMRQSMQKSLDDAIAKNSGGDPSWLRGLSICQSCDNWVTQLAYYARTARAAVATVSQQEEERFARIRQQEYQQHLKEQQQKKAALAAAHRAVLQKMAAALSKIGIPEDVALCIVQDTNALHAFQAWIKANPQSNVSSSDLDLITDVAENIGEVTSAVAEAMAKGESIAVGIANGLASAGINIGAGAFYGWMQGQLEVAAKKLADDHVKQIVKAQALNKYGVIDGVGLDGKASPSTIFYFKDCSGAIQVFRISETYQFEYLGSV